MLWYAVVLDGPELLSAPSGYREKKKEKKQSSNGDGQGEGSQPAVVHVGDGGVGLGVLREAHEAEAETTAATGIAVLDDNLRMSVTVAKVKDMEETYGLLDLAEPRLNSSNLARRVSSLVCQARPPSLACQAGRRGGHARPLFVKVSHVAETMSCWR